MLAPADTRHGVGDLSDLHPAVRNRFGSAHEVRSFFSILTNMLLHENLLGLLLGDPTAAALSMKNFPPASCS